MVKKVKGYEHTYRVRAGARLSGGDGYPWMGGLA